MISYLSFFVKRFLSEKSPPLCANEHYEDSVFCQHYEKVDEFLMNLLCSYWWRQIKTQTQITSFLSCVNGCRQTEMAVSNMRVYFALISMRMLHSIGFRSPTSASDQILLKFLTMKMSNIDKKEWFKLN